MVHVNGFSYGPVTPVLGFVMSSLGCFLGLRCTTRARASPGAPRVRWLLLAAVSIATTGIWVMHFVAMLGFTIPGQTITYSVPVTVLSMLIAVVVVGIGLLIVGFGSAGWRNLLLGGVIIGFGVASMHYIGMAAMKMPDTVRYNNTLVVLSVVMAVVAGTMPAAPMIGSTRTAARSEPSRSRTASASSASLNGNSTTSCATPGVTPAGTPAASKLIEESPTTSTSAMPW